MNYFKYFIVKGITLISIIGSAQNDSVLKFSLAAAQNYAIDNFYMSKNAELDIESAKKVVKETTAIGLPQISGGVDYTYIPEVPEASFGGSNYLFSSLPGNQPITSNDINDGSIGIGFIPMDPIPLGVEHNVTYNIMLTQLLFNGEYIVGLQASKTYKQLSEEAYEKTSIELKEMVAGTYYSILILEKNKTLLNESLQNLQSIYFEIKKSGEFGMVESTEVDQIGINVSRTENTLKSIERQIELMHKMFRYQLGLNPEDQIELTENIDQLVSANLINITQIDSFRLDSNIDYRMLETQERISELSLKREKSTYLPSLSAFYKYEDKLEKATLDFSMKHMIGVSLSVPIFNSGAKNARVSQARIELEKNQLIKEQKSHLIEMEAEQARFDYINALEAYTNEENNFNLSSRVLENTIAKHEHGMASSMDLTLANNQFLDAQVSLSAAILNLLNAKTTLDKTCNKL
jgi:outer membrane protein TolC